MEGRNVCSYTLEVWMGSVSESRANDDVMGEDVIWSCCPHSPGTYWIVHIPPGGEFREDSWSIHKHLGFLSGMARPAEC